MAVLFEILAETEKCFLDERLSSKTKYTHGSMLRGERFSFQAAYRDNEPKEWRTTAYLTVESPIAEYITMQRIDCVPVRTPAAYGCSDDNFLRTEPGLYPDLLRPIDERSQIYITGQLQSVWFDITVPEDAPAGTYPIKLTLTDASSGEVLATAEFSAMIIGAVLPEQKITVTQWFYPDCLAVYYGVEVFSEEHWAIMAQYIRCAAQNGINMILTPVFTPALDTAVGTERPTVQLVDISFDGGKWSFGFEKLVRWVSMCRELGIEYFEIAHLFTQWGAEHAPKVMASADGEYKKVFGWDTDACGDDYIGFLSEFIPALLAQLKALGVCDKTVFHISDEPGEQHFDSYMAAKNAVRKLLDGQIIMDALSDFSFYEKGVVERPVVSIDHMKPYVDAGVPDLWTYYCCCQWKGVSNRFIAMPTARNRIIGQQFYKYNIAGFLQWGFNFYFTQGSDEACDPYLCTDGGCWVPAGDTFSVYPAPGGGAYESIHLLGFTAALNDLRAFSLCETLCGRDAVMAVIEEAGEVGFDKYPTGDGQVLCVREKINAMIADAVR